MATSESAIIYLFTRTSLHVGSGGSVGAIDLPIIRERHTAFPIIPGSALKGVFADEWIEINENTYQSNDAEIKEHIYQRNTEGKDLFGTEEKGGMLQFSEAKLLLFPIRSPKGCFGWITCPLILKRYCRDTGQTILDSIQLSDNKALFKKESCLCINEGGKEKVILEEYIFEKTQEDSEEIIKAFVNQLPVDLVSIDPIWKEIGNRLVIVSDSMMSFFTQSACEIAQHVKINDKTGTAESGALFNQENVPSETAFYSIVRKGPSRNENSFKPIEVLEKKIKEKNYLFQFGADAGTGLGYCTTYLTKTTHKEGESNNG